MANELRFGTNKGAGFVCLRWSILPSLISAPPSVVSLVMFLPTCWFPLRGTRITYRVRSERIRWIWEEMSTSGLSATLSVSQILVTIAI